MKKRFTWPQFWIGLAFIVNFAIVYKRTNFDFNISFIALALVCFVLLEAGRRGRE